MFLKQKFNLQFILTFLLKVFLFILPWQTIWIYQESFFGNYKNQFTTLGFYFSEILLWVIVALFMVWYYRKYRSQKLRSKKFKLSNDRIFILFILLFLIYCFVSSFWALDFAVAWQQALRIMGMFLFFFVLYLGPVNKKEIYKWIILGSILPIFLGLYQFIFQFTFSNKYLGLSVHPIWEAGSSVVVGSFGRLLRAYGSFAHPNIFAGYLFIVLLASFLFFGKKEKTNLIYYIFFGLLMISMFFTFSRSALLAVILLIFCFLFYSVKNKSKTMGKVSVFNFILFFVLLFSLWPVFQSRLSSGSVNEIQSIEERTSGIKEAFDIWSQDKWFGVGIGNYTLALWHLDKWQPSWQYQPVHNVALLFLVELGLVGILLFILIIISFFVYYSSIVNKRSLLWFVLFLISFLVLMIFDHYLWSFYIGLLLNSLFFSLILAKK